jgi:hypothetical protein
MTDDRLPVRNLVDVHLADAVVADGCPICSMRRRAEQAYVRSLLWEGVNDRAIREELDRAGGYCARHTHVLLADSRRQSGPAVGAAILFQAILRLRLEALATIRSSRGRRRRGTLAAASRVPRCPVCGVSDEAAKRAMDAIVAQLGDARWVAALERARFCLADFAATWSAAGSAADGDAWRHVVDAQLERIERVRDLLERFAYHNSADRRHLLTDEERASVAQAEALLAGDTAPRDVGRRPA